MIAAQTIELDQIGSFGVVDLAVPGGDRVAGVRQRPDPDTVAEPLAVVSRLVLRPVILPRLTARPHVGSEVDLGLAVADLAATGDVRVHRLTGTWVTVGEPHRYRHALQCWHDHCAPAPPAPAPRLGKDRPAPC
ncbi:hypothetical protein [Actinomadura sp. NEAU-AAG7]|uniref:hypothetical protein n=1 Tax=Actinomadura sp. NEAU-AAG7 TaxID=2839640 RepID=UPI001BE3D1B6|nr:hypothetical protein [Actinomadura sp. NEAU-AAG7]MBT2212432.1 hypothetical protein [Actinomadura sp. NEAU-AAG7]